MSKGKNKIANLDKTIAEFFGVVSLEQDFLDKVMEHSSAMLQFHQEHNAIIIVKLPSGFISADQLNIDVFCNEALLAGYFGARPLLFMAGVEPVELEKYLRDAWAAWYRKSLVYIEIVMVAWCLEYHGLEVEIDTDLRGQPFLKFQGNNYDLRLIWEKQKIKVA